MADIVAEGHLSEVAAGGELPEELTAPVHGQVPLNDEVHCVAVVALADQQVVLDCDHHPQLEGTDNIFYFIYYGKSLL
eukprot:2961831-Pyramimonas_sp.AAC.1